jgi:mannosyl-oligosaccharide alpha-1,2-mannosidase
VIGSRPVDDDDSDRAIVEQPKPKPAQQPIDDKDSDGTWGATGTDEEHLGYKTPSTNKDKSTEDDTGKLSSHMDSDANISPGGSSSGKFTHDPLDTETVGGADSAVYPPTKDASDSTSPANLQWNNPPKPLGQEPEVPPKNRIHWEKQEEHFPLPTNSIIPIPTGTPKKIPTIQYNFAPESVEAKTKRLERQERVKTEIQRAWAGYKKYAWLHDELSPVSGKFRDPFCGWAATLVDSLDTLWIAGMKTEFDEAAKAVGKIDFTWSPRNEIPVFETTIRYLGGLIAAYDVSGGPKGSYSVLLDKAVELAEILMGIFDTPNRMPLLYYHWKPEFASQPHRAGRVGIAELATLSMEFTRLAQLTKEAKYYDAIDRITDGLVKMQEVGTTIRGLFPENIDISGCNKTATTLRDEVSRAAQKQMETAELDEPTGYSSSQEQRTPGQDSRSGSTILRKRDAAAPEDGPKRPAHLPPSLTFNDGTKPGDPVIPAGNEVAGKTGPPYAANGLPSEWDCVPQGFVPGGWGYESYHMGGGQDSAYEYFPKVSNLVFCLVQ